MYLHFPFLLYFRKTLLAALILLMFTGGSIAQSTTDSLHYHRKKVLWKKSVLPLTLIASGSFVSGSGLEKRFQDGVRKYTGPNYHVEIDDYTQYAPIVQLYIANLAGIDSRNHWFDQTKYLFLSNLSTALVIRGLKIVIGKKRPYGGNHSFPSGHTGVAFTNAAVLFHEYESTAPWLAWSGYGFALTTGVFRVANNEHWVSDVITSAGIGMLFTALVYHFEPFQKFNPFINRNKEESAFQFQVGLKPEGIALIINL
jgi:membrane-associated phospholipid phosphatase